MERSHKNYFWNAVCNTLDVSNTVKRREGLQLYPDTSSTGQIMTRKRNIDSPFAKNLDGLMREHVVGVRGAARVAEVSPSISEEFEEGDDIFDGIAKITITRLIPKNKK